MLTNQSEVRLAEQFLAQLNQIVTYTGYGASDDTTEARLGRTLDALRDLQMEYRLRLQLARRLQPELRVSWDCDAGPAIHTRPTPLGTENRCPAAARRRALHT